MKKQYLPLSLTLITLLLSSCTQVVRPRTSTSTTTSSFPSSSTSPIPTTTSDDGREEDLREFEFKGDYTVTSLSSTDDYNRVLMPVDNRDGKRSVGLFYHVWHGYHSATGASYNITELLKNNPAALWSVADDNPLSPLHLQHYWGTPLYNYYDSRDTWVQNRHVELLTMLGVDYLVYDTTNISEYDDAIAGMYQTLDKYYRQGFKVPKVVFYTNTNAAIHLTRLYKKWYQDDDKSEYSEERYKNYPNLWYHFKGNEKPLIITDRNQLYEYYGSPTIISGGEQKPNPNYNIEFYNELNDFFDIYDSQWPGKPEEDRPFPWMDWNLTQKNYRGIMSVSLAQHPNMRMSLCEGQNSRGFSRVTMEKEADYRKGTNFEEEFDYAISQKNKLDTVMVTGFNEWLAMKFDKVDGAKEKEEKSFFVDLFNEECSRDVEMTANEGGYGDNFFLQLGENMRDFSFTPAKSYKLHKHTIDVSNFATNQFEDVKTMYMDFEGEVMERDSILTDHVTPVKDTTNRNDVVTTHVTHDDQNLYLRIKTKENITEKNINDKAWMNILINTGDTTFGFKGYNFIVNRDVTNRVCSIEKLDENFNTTLVGTGETCVVNNVMQVKIPLEVIGKSSSNITLSFKVTDNIQKQNDILDYYVSGESAPIGRLNYTYGI